MLKKYKTILERAEMENIIEKSRFIGYVKPIENEEQAIQFVDEKIGRASCRERV